MTRAEREHAFVVRQCIEGRLSQREASERLGIGVRQVKRLMRRGRRDGDAGLVSRQRGAPSHRRMSEVLRARIGGLLQENYPDFGPTLPAVHQWHAVARPPRRHPRRAGPRAVPVLLRLLGGGADRNCKRRHCHRWQDRAAVRAQAKGVGADPHGVRLSRPPMPGARPGQGGGEVQRGPSRRRPRSPPSPNCLSCSPSWERSSPSMPSAASGRSSRRSWRRKPTTCSP